MKRMLILLAVVVAIVVIASVHFDGEIRPVSPQLAVAIRDSASWYADPHLAADPSDPAAVYVVVPEVPHGDRFDAIRVATATGEQRQTTIAFGPSNAYRDVIPDVAVRGLRFTRPVFHLFSFPENQGPGFHGVDSATGAIVISVDDNGRQRPLLERKAFNSSSAAVMASRVSTDPAGRWLAALSRTPGGWMLFLFPRSAASGRAGH